MKKPEFKTVRFRRVTDVIESRISNMIIKGTVKPGERLPTEKELSDQFDVSMVTIREALRGLQSSGLIQKKRGKNGGIFATEINNDSVRTFLSNYLKRRKFSPRHLSEVRLSIEPVIIKIAAERITLRELAEIDENITYCEEKLAKAQSNIPLKDYYEIGQKNVDYHRLIAQATHNPVFALTEDYVMDFISEFKKSVFTPDVDHNAQIVREHRDIFNSLKEKDGEASASKMIFHLQYVENYQMNDSNDSPDSDTA
jgi:GntR family transcriptional regulator, transcriptional repressor for pyruvate dehydrogenase complex